MMKRPVLQAAIAYCAGIALAYYIRQIIIIIAVIPVLLFISWYGRKRNIPYPGSFLLCGIFMICGFANYAFQYTILSKPLVQYYENNVTLAGYVNSECRTEGSRVTFEFHVEKINNEKVGRTVLVNVYNVKNADDYSVGTGLVINGVLRSPPGSRNPGGFNYENYLYTKRIPATLSINERNAERTGFMKNLPLKRFGVNIRRYILASLEKNLSYEKAALIEAMLIGYRENLTESMENAFSASGLTHIMAVSGANLAFLIFPLLWLLNIAGIDRRTSAVIAIPFVFVYLLITGMEASVLRASVMAVLLLLGRALYRKTELVNSIAVAVLVLLLINPFMFFDAGFQLSVGATLGLGILYKRIRDIFPEKVPGFVSETLAATIAAQAGVLPLLITHFNKVSLISLVSNLLVVPVTGFATTLGAVSIIAGSIHPFPGEIAGYALEAVLHFILVVTEKCASAKWAEIYMHHWSYPFMFAYYAAVFLWGIYGVGFFRRNKSVMIAGVLAAGLFLFIRGIMPSPLKVIFADVGQGDCILIRTPEGRSFLIDGGGSQNESENDYHGRRIILPMLMHEKIHQIDMAIATHAHSDHVTGILTLTGIYDVKSVGLPGYPGAENDFEKLIGLCNSRNIPVFFYNEGDIIHMDGKTTFEVLNPPPEPPAAGGLNNTSVCGMLRYKDLSILFTGDIEAEGEKNLVKHGTGIDCDILKVAHHGARESTTPEFLELARPEVAIISVGRNNYGHPSDEVTERLLQAGTKIFTTEESGAVIVTSDGNEYRLKTWVKDLCYTLFPKWDQ
ncbi:MAG: DNA internalization-related competence protein ComEC/Rec2 [Clostridiaceae bacterium]|nr:DNA internalization-related competence protein ComEC/Rec2 [Clostridiaceae bacterium]